MSDPIHPVLDRGFVTLIDEPNSDLKVVNAARVSFAKKSTTLEERDAKLIQYLAKNNHWTPFAHCRALTPMWVSSMEIIAAYANAGGMQFLYDESASWCEGGHGFLVSHSLAHLLLFPELACNYEDDCPVSAKALANHDGCGAKTRVAWSLWPEEEPVTLHIKMPLFVAAQWKRSTVGIVYNEVSRRYVDDPPEIHTTDKLRGRPPASLKQGSSDEIIDYTPFAFRIEPPNGLPGVAVGRAEQACVLEYTRRLRAGVAPEQARIVLPVSTYTELWMTCSLKALARVLKLRLDPHAQWEVRQYAQAVRDLVAPKYPILETLL